MTTLLILIIGMLWFSYSSFGLFSIMLSAMASLLTISRNGFILVFFILSGESIIVDAAISRIFLQLKSELTFLSACMGMTCGYCFYDGGESYIMIDSIVSDR